MTKLFSEVPTIVGERLLLRPIEESDAPSLERLARSDSVYRYLPTFL